MLIFQRMSAAAKPLVIIFEDDDASADGLTLILEDWGAQVIRAESVQPITELLGKRVGDIACIITDFNLGAGPNGVTLTRELLGLAPNARVLVLSGSFHGRAALSAAAAGYEIMQKPATAASIIEWLEQA
jgi:DNA-binding NtrC family response regulator